jgi:hypothetical protein
LVTTQWVIAVLLIAVLLITVLLITVLLITVLLITALRMSLENQIHCEGAGYAIVELEPMRKRDMFGGRFSGEFHPRAGTGFQGSVCGFRTSDGHSSKGLCF